MTDRPDADHPQPAGHADLEAALIAALRAPSIYNSQPWRFRLDDDAILVHADPARHLGVVDPDRHSMLISIGAVVTALQIALRGQGWTSSIEHHDLAGDGDLVATVRVAGARTPGVDDEQCRAALARRFSDRRPFAAEAVSDDVLDEIASCAASAQVAVSVVNSEDEYIKLSVAMSRAADVLRADPAYRAELSGWVHDDDDHDDGFGRSAIPHLTGGHARHTDVALRDLGGQGNLEIEDVDERPSLAIIATQDSGPQASLAAGEAMMRVMVEAEARGVMTCAISQAVDLPAMRTQLRGALGWTAYPQMIIRLGRPRTDQRPPLTRRRPLADLLVPDHTG